MKINLDEVIMGLEGEPVMDDKNVPITVKRALVLAINAPKEDQGDSSLYMIGLKVGMSEGMMELEVEEQMALKTRVSQIYPSPVMRGRLHDVIEGKEIRTV